jgi:hypothetical protein
MVFDLNPFKPVIFSSTAKNKVTKKKPLANYVLHPIIFDILYALFPNQCNHFELVNHTSLMIGSQSRPPCRAVQLGEAERLNNPVSPM